MQLDLFSILLLGLTGFIAGGINTVAGGGSNLTLPALMMFGLPADIANGTNRLSVLMQCMSGLPVIISTKCSIDRRQFQFSFRVF